IATGRLAFALDGRASHHGCSDVSAAAAGADRIAVLAPNPAPAPAAAAVLINPLRPSTDGRDAPCESFIIVLRAHASTFSESRLPWKVRMVARADVRSRPLTHTATSA